MKLQKPPATAVLAGAGLLRWESMCIYMNAHSFVLCWPGVPAETRKPAKRQPQLLVSGGALVREAGRERGKEGEAVVNPASHSATGT